MVSEWGERFKNKRCQVTPGTPNQSFIKVSREEDMVPISDKEHKIYQSVVGKLLYLLKYSRPELSNCVREVSKAMKMAGEKHVKEVIRILTFILHNPNQALFVKPESILKNPTIDNIKEFKWEIDGMSDSTWANKTEEGHSITGWIIRIMGALAGWGCRQIKQSHYLQLNQNMQQHLRWSKNYSL